MSFGISILMNVFIDVKTGMPCIRRMDSVEILNPYMYIVPKEYCKYTTRNGDVMRKYIPRDSKQKTEISIQHCIDNFPQWNPHMETDSWKEQNHDEFKVALHWFAEKGVYSLHFGLS